MFKWLVFINQYLFTSSNPRENLCPKTEGPEMDFTERSLNSWHDFIDKRGWVSLKPHPEGRRFSHRTPTEGSDKGSKV